MLFHASAQRFVRPAHLSLAFRVLFIAWLALPLALWPSISASPAAPASIPIPTDLTATPVSFQDSAGAPRPGAGFPPAPRPGGPAAEQVGAASSAGPLARDTPYH